MFGCLFDSTGCTMHCKTTLKDGRLAYLSPSETLFVKLLHVQGGLRKESSIINTLRCYNSAKEALC